MLECFTTHQDGALRIIATGEAALPAWLEAHSQYRDWIATVGFKGEPGSFAFLPGEGSRPTALLAAPHEDGAVWGFAGLPFALPVGTYAIESDGLARASDVALGWALGSYAFTRYRKAKRPPAQLVWPANAERAEVERVAQAV